MYHNSIFRLFSNIESVKQYLDTFKYCLTDCHKYNTYIFIALLFFNPICKMYDEKMGGMGRLPRNLPST